MRLVFLFWIILTYSVLSGQDVGLRSFSVAEGLAQSQVYSMLEDQQGFLWFGTQGGGLSRFDGEQFVNFHQRDGLVNDYILSMAETQDGRLWIGTRDGVSCYDGERFQTILFPTTDVVAVNDLHCDYHGRMWAATNQGLFRLLGDSALLQPVSLGAKLTCVQVDSSEQLWIGTANQGLFVYKNEALQKIGRAQGLRGFNISDIAIRGGEVWVSTYSGGVFRGNENSFERFRPVEGFPRGLVFDIEFEKESTIWVATQDDGVWSVGLADSSIQHFTEVEGLADDHVRALLVDSWANIWMGTSGGGLSRFQGQPFGYYSRRQGLREQVYAIAEDADCALWLGNADRGLAVLAGDSMRYFTQNQLSNTKVKTLHRGSRDMMWIGTEGNGLARYHNGEFMWFGVQNGLGGNWVRAIEEDSAGNIYVGKAGGGLSMLKPDSSFSSYQVSRIRKGSHLWADRINALAFDRKQRLWLGTYSNGIGYLASDNRLVNISLPGGSATKLVRCLIQGPKGHMWAGTAGGIVRISATEGDSLEILLLRDKLFSQNIYSLTFDEDANLWAGTESGLDKLILNSTGDVIEISHFGAAEGFLGIENCQGASLRDRNGRLWFGTINGLTAYTPGTLKANPVPPKVSLMGVQLFYAPIQNTPYAGYANRYSGIGPDLELSPSDNHLSFTFIGINHRNPKSVSYSWRMLGSERVWSPPSDRTQATYSQLPPGEYRFQVRACNEDGVWSAPISTPAFVLQPPLVQQTWFQVLVAMISLLVLGLGVGWYVQNLRRNARKKEEQLELDKRMLELEQKALQLQMNPHFIFHALNGIQGLIQQQDTATARKHLGRFSTLMRRVLQHARQGTISLEEEVEALEDYLAVEHMSRGESFDYAITYDDDIEADFVELPPMLLQPLVENALIHGLSGLDRKGKLEVHFSLEHEDLLLAVVRDSGKGRAAAKSASRTDGHISTALTVTRERLATLGDEGGLEFVDLYGENGAAAGTEVRVRIPLT